MSKESFLERSDAEFIKAIEDDASFNRMLHGLSLNRRIYGMKLAGLFLLWVFTVLISGMAFVKGKHFQWGDFIPVLFGYIVCFGGFIQTDMKIKMLKSLRKRNSTQGV